MKAAINARLWDDAAGAYRDTYDKTYIPQEGNALAVLFGIAEGDRASRALAAVKRENWSPWGSAILSAEKPDGSYYDMHTRGGNRTISPAMCTWEAQARFAPCAGFDSFAGVVPTPKGLAAVRCEMRGGKKHYTLCVPKGVAVQTALPDGAELELTEY